MSVNNHNPKPSNPVDSIFENLKKSTASFEDFERSDSLKASTQDKLDDDTIKKVKAQKNLPQSDTAGSASNNLKTTQEVDTAKPGRKKKVSKTPRTFYLTDKTLKLLKKISYYTDRDFSDLINESIQDLSFKYK